MLQRISLALVVLMVVAGCGPTPQQKYDAAVRDYERAQSRLDNLRPAFDAAREKAVLKVCKEIAGTTPEESAANALSQLQGGLDDGSLLGQLTGDQASGDQAAGAKKDNRPVGDADAALDQLMAAQKKMQEVQSAATAPVVEAQKVMTKIKTPGTPENKRFDEVFAAMPEVKAYQRQEKRVERAQQAVDDAEAALPETERSDAD